MGITATKERDTEFNCVCKGVFISILSNINRLVFNAIGLCDLKHSYDFNSVLMMLRHQI